MSLHPEPILGAFGGSSLSLVCFTHKNSELWIVCKYSMNHFSAWRISKACLLLFYYYYWIQTLRWGTVTHTWHPRTANPKPLISGSGLQNSSHTWPNKLNSPESFLDCSWVQKKVWKCPQPSFRPSYSFPTTPPTVFNNLVFPCKNLCALLIVCVCIITTGRVYVLGKFFRLLAVWVIVWMISLKFFWCNFNRCISRVRYWHCAYPEFLWSLPTLGLHKTHTHTHTQNKEAKVMHYRELRYSNPVNNWCYWTYNKFSIP